MSLNNLQTRPSACEPSEHVIPFNLDLQKSLQHWPIQDLNKRKAHLVSEQTSKRRLLDSGSSLWSRGSTPLSIPESSSQHGEDLEERDGQANDCISKEEPDHDMLEELKYTPRLHTNSEASRSSTGLGLYLCTPALTMSDCSSKRSSSAQFVASPRSAISDDHDFIDREIAITSILSSPDSSLDCPSNVGFQCTFVHLYSSLYISYHLTNPFSMVIDPSVLDLGQEQSVAELKYDPWAHLPFFVEGEVASWQENYIGDCSVHISDTDAAPSDVPHFVICGTDGIPKPVDVIDLTSPPRCDSVNKFRIFKAPFINVEKEELENRDEPPTEMVNDSAIFTSRQDDAYPRLQVSSHNHTGSSPTKVVTLSSASPGIQLRNEESPLEIKMCLKKDSIEDWSLDIPEDIDNQEIGDVQSPSTTILMATAEEDLEERVRAVTGDDHNYGQALLANLKEKLPEILPLFCGEDFCGEDYSPLEFSNYASSVTYGSGYTNRSGSSSAPPSDTKSSAGVSINTSATSSGSSRKHNRADDEENHTGRDQRQPSKKPKASRPGTRGVQDRRRFKCHFYTKCPLSHTKKTCVMSGWPSIHHLRGHYESHHTTIRCNKCFKEFEGPYARTEKNRHQKGCKIEAAPPSLEVIDCDKKDELEESLGFRTWQLHSEPDEVMKAWILKYKPEYVTNNAPTDEAYDSRELAKWYRIWQTLFPDLRTPVPSPFQDTSILPADLKIERLLEIFQSIVDTNIQQDRKPPADQPQQIDYYKECVRKLFKIILPRAPSSENMLSGSATNQRGDTRSISTPANSGTTSAPGIHTPSSSRVSTQRLERSKQTQPVEYLNSSPRDRSSSPVADLSTSPRLPPRNGFLVTSPCSAETKGAVGETPVIVRTVPINRSRGNSASDSSLNMHPHAREVPRGNLSLQIPRTTGSPQVRATSRSPMTNLMPPPQMRQRASVSPSHSHAGNPAQVFQDSAMDFTLTNNLTAFNASMTPSNFNFIGLAVDQGSPVWPNVAVPQPAAVGCQYCMDSGIIYFETHTQTCLMCGDNDM
ncbi:hypothetical protein BP5796_02859 [Coleophoma crateriformis]|uniref:C2H2-type domain-containing protein n=1 Tax=Coleophoma crateriformis TaxID=565419 RepID=A0A3D8SZH3_9HELO|nr:hypothetical protein BP5796_02859 [Coleophoma crateriformis]